MAATTAFYESLCDLEVPNAIRISPDGKQVVYSTQLTWGHKKGPHPVSTLWLATIGVENSARKITSGEFNDNAPVWLPQGKAIAFISDRAQPGQKWAIYILSLQDGSSPYALTPSDHKEGITAFKCSPDGKTIAYISSDEKSAEEIRVEEAGEDVQVWGQGHRFARLRVINLETKEIRSLEIERHVFELCWSPNGERLAILNSATPELQERILNGTKISIVDFSSMAVSKDACTRARMPEYLSWANDGKLYYRNGIPVDALFSGWALYGTDPEKQEDNLERVQFGLHEDIVGMTMANNGIPVAKVESRLEARMVLVDGTVVHSENQEIETSDAYFGDTEDLVAYATSDVNHPAEVFTKSNKDGQPVQVSNLGSAFKDRQFGVCSTLTFPSLDKTVEVDALYLTPALAASSQNASGPLKPLPTVVFIHGGPNGRHTNVFNSHYYMWSPYILSLGYGILLPNYRGSSGRGAEFASAIIGNVGKRDYEDVIAATQYAIERGYADKDNLLVAGYSHGGLISLCCSVRNGLHGLGWKFKAAMAGAAIADTDCMALTSDQGCVYLPECSGGRVIWKMEPDDTRTRQSSAIWEVYHAVQESKRKGEMVIPPMLILHGDAETRVSVSNAVGMCRALESHGLPFECAIYPRQGHLISEQKFWIDMAQRLGKFCDKHIGSSK